MLTTATDSSCVGLLLRPRWAASRRLTRRWPLPPPRSEGAANPGDCGGRANSGASVPGARGAPNRAPPWDPAGPGSSRQTEWIVRVRRLRRLSTALAWIWDTRDSVTPSTSPIWASVIASK